ncbi:hypothetical protein [Serratia rhizosphaerae]|uniref:Tail fiber protein n=1 Tax=Serratia rhizosphaerae TaxID=2597702 RepID=A0ABX6GNZ4_9GAMM|nr:hypothetical protein [Serratia rhizosphaerae]QHA88011.1 hypothetical protein FO014_14165 [Serratia rhizosphaerae]
MNADVIINEAGQRVYSSNNPQRIDLSPYLPISELTTPGVVHSVMYMANISWTDDYGVGTDVPGGNLRPTGIMVPVWQEMSTAGTYYNDGWIPSGTWLCLGCARHRDDVNMFSLYIRIA